MSGEHVRLERCGGVLRLLLDRPPLNVLHLPMLRELAVALDEVKADPEVKVLVVAGAGRAFCAGVDVADHVAERVHEMLPAFHEVIRKLVSVECAVVAAVHGAALGGGCELLLACDVVLARADARLGQPEIRLGAFPPVAAALMPRRIGLQRTMDLVLSGRTLDAAEAERLGLVQRVLPVDGFGDAVDALVAELAALSRPVLRLAKRAVVEGLELGAGPALDLAERLYLEELLRYGDPHEGLAAFLEKRPPVWRDA